MLLKHDLKYQREYHRHVVLSYFCDSRYKKHFAIKFMLNYASLASANKSICMINIKALFNTELSNTVLILFLKSFRG